MAERKIEVQRAGKIRVSAVPSRYSCIEEFMLDFNGDPGYSRDEHFSLQEVNTFIKKNKEFITFECSGGIMMKIGRFTFDIVTGNLCFGSIPGRVRILVEEE